MRALFHNPCHIRGLPFPRPFFSVGGWYQAELVQDEMGEWRISSLTEDISYNQVWSQLLLFALQIIVIVLALLFAFSPEHVPAFLKF